MNHNAAGRPIRVLVADDHQPFAEAVAFVLGSDGIEVVGHAWNGAEAVRLAGELQPDVVLMDVHMPELNGIEATRCIRTVQHPPSVLMVSASTDPADVNAARKAGAEAYLVKDFPSAELIEAVRAAAARPVAPLCGGGAAPAFAAVFAA